MSRRTPAKVTTKTGDSGMTGVLGPERLAKDHPRIEALGAIDEATSALGMARAWGDDAAVCDILLRIQRQLYILMAELATTTPRGDAIGLRLVADDVTWLERVQEGLLPRAAVPRYFILPGATRAGATLDFARATVRRAERAVARLYRTGEVANSEALRYLNRLSDLIFVLARSAEAATGGSTPARPSDQERQRGEDDAHP